MAGSNYLNSASHAKIVCDSKIFDVQDHEIEALALAGVKQHRFSWSQLERTTGFRKEAGIEATAELTADEYTQMRDHMDQQRLEPQAKKAKTTTPKVVSEEEKQNRIANTAKSAGLRKLKQKIDNVTNLALAFPIAEHASLSQRCRLRFQHLGSQVKTRRS